MNRLTIWVLFLFQNITLPLIGVCPFLWRGRAGGLRNSLHYNRCIIAGFQQIWVRESQAVRIARASFQASNIVTSKFSGISPSGDRTLVCSGYLWLVRIVAPAVPLCYTASSATFPCLYACKDGLIGEAWSVGWLRQ